MPLGCICMEESFASTTATRHLCSGHQQDQIFENVNATNPAKLITADDELLQRSVSSGSFGFHCSGKQRQQSQSFNSSLAISTESDATSIASAAADRIVSSSSSPSFVDRISPYAFLCVLKRFFVKIVQWCKIFPSTPPAHSFLLYSP